jgi:hypothetical protein
VALEIKKGYIYVCKASTFSTQSVVQRGTHFRLEDSIGSGDNAMVSLFNPAGQLLIIIKKDVFERSFELFEPTIVSPRAASYDQDTVSFLKQ